MTRKHLAPNSLAANKLSQVRLVSHTPPAPFPELSVPADTKKAVANIPITEPVLEPPSTGGITGTETNHLTLDDLVRMALHEHPAIAQVEAEVRRLRGAWYQAGLPPNPTVGYSASEIGNDGQAGQQGLYVGRTFIRGNKLALDREILCQQIMQAEQKLAAQHLRIANEVRQAYYRLQVAQKRVKLAQQLVAISDAAVRSSQRLVDAGEVGRVALLQSQIQLQQASIVKRRAKNTRVAAQRALNAAVGGTEIGERLNGDLPAVETGSAARVDWDQALARVLNENPLLSQAALEISRAQSVLRRALAEPIPDVNVQVAVQYDFATDYVVSGVQVGVPLPLWNRNQGGVAAARAAIASEQHALAKLQLDLERRLAEEYQQLKSAEFELERYESELIPAADETMQIVSRAYAAGEASYLEQVNAQRMFFETNLQFLDAQTEYWQARTTIDGLLITESRSVQ